jgi:hypothetical protein
MYNDLKIQAFWYKMLCHCASSFHRLLNVNRKPPQSFKISKSTCPMTVSHLGRLESSESLHHTVSNIPSHPTVYDYYTEGSSKHLSYV